MGKSNKTNKRKFNIMTQREIDTKKMLALDRLDKLEKKGGSPRIVSKLKRRLRSLNSMIAAE